MLKKKKSVSLPTFGKKKVKKLNWNLANVERRKFKLPPKGK